MSVFEQRLHQMVQKACYEVGMLPGDDILALPEKIRELKDRPCLSWDGFNVYGDKKSIAEVADLIHYRAARTPHRSARIDIEG